MYAGTVQDGVYNFLSCKLPVKPEKLKHLILGVTFLMNDCMIGFLTKELDKEWRFTINDLRISKPKMTKKNFSLLTISDTNCCRAP